MRKWIIGFVVWLVLIAVLAVAWPRLNELSGIGAGYVAKEVCSCMALGGRDYKACRADLPPQLDFDRVQSEPLPNGAGVRAWVPFFAERTALAEPGRGCTLKAQRPGR
jgi:hypothetical protein